MGSETSRPLEFMRDEFPVLNIVLISEGWRFQWGAGVPGRLGSATHHGQNPETERGAVVKQENNLFP